jgi:hypothetical protein
VWINVEKTLKEKLASFQKKVFPLWPLFKHGFVAERLGTALQKLLQRFESARNLPESPRSYFL